MNTMFTEIRDDFKEFEKDVLRIVPDIDPQEIMDYYLTAVFSIWSQNKFYSPDYTRFLEVLTGRKYTQEQVMTTFDFCSAPDYRVDIPWFFKKCVRIDVEKGWSGSIRLVRKLNDILVASSEALPTRPAWKDRQSTSGHSGKDTHRRP